jgi:hypothetical protein
VLLPRAAGATLAPERSAPVAPASGHTDLLHGLGDAGDVPPAHLPALLRMAHASGGGARELAASARGLAAWRACLARGLLPDDEALAQLIRDGDGGREPSELAWPAEPLRTTLLRGLGKLGVAAFAGRYPAVQAALLTSLLQTGVTYHRRMAGLPDEDTGPELDGAGNAYVSVTQARAEEAAARAARRGSGNGNGNSSSSSSSKEDAANSTASAAAAAAAASAPPRAGAAALAALPADRQLAASLVKELYFSWKAPMEALSAAGRAFQGLEALLGGGEFDLQGGLWRRQVQSLVTICMCAHTHTQYTIHPHTHSHSQKNALPLAAAYLSISPIRLEINFVCRAGVSSMICASGLRTSKSCATLCAASAAEEDGDPSGTHCCCSL